MLSLRPADLWMALCAAVLIPAYQFAVRAQLYRPSAWPMQTSRTLSTGQFHQAAKLAAMVNAVARNLPWRVSCLTRSLVLVSLLRHQGIESRLRIGARMSEGSLDAHAWAEHEGVPVNDHQGIGMEYPAFDGELSSKAFGS